MFNASYYKDDFAVFFARIGKALAKWLTGFWWERSWGTVEGKERGETAVHVYINRICSYLPYYNALIHTTCRSPVKGYKPLMFSGIPLKTEKKRDKDNIFALE